MSVLVDLQGGLKTGTLFVSLNFIKYTVTKDSTTSKMCRYTILVKFKCLTSNN